MSIGIDIIKSKRIKQKHIQRFLTKVELDIYNKCLTKKTKLEFASGRWAAKESLIKASNKQLIFSKISIIKSEGGMPLVYYDGVERSDMRVSISHEKKYTIAMATILKN